MHEDDNKRSIKEIECKKRRKNAWEIKCMKEIKMKCRGGYARNRGGAGI